MRNARGGTSNAWVAGLDNARSVKVSARCRKCAFSFNPGRRALPAAPPGTRVSPSLAGSPPLAMGNSTYVVVSIEYDDSRGARRATGGNTEQIDAAPRPRSVGRPTVPDDGMVARRHSAPQGRRPDPPAGGIEDLQLHRLRSRHPATDPGRAPNGVRSDGVEREPCRPAERAECDRIEVLGRPGRDRDPVGPRAERDDAVPEPGEGDGVDARGGARGRPGGGRVPPHDPPR